MKKHVDAIVRTAEQRDCAAVCVLRKELSRRSWRERPDFFRPEPLGLTEANFAGLLANAEFTVLVAEVEPATVAGYAKIWMGANDGSDWTFPSRNAYLEDLLVDARFRRHGIGGMLLARVEALASAAGAEALGLSVQSNNPGARAFYDVNGFRAQSEYRRKVLNPQVRIERA